MLGRGQHPVSPPLRAEPHGSPPKSHPHPKAIGAGTFMGCPWCRGFFFWGGGLGSRWGSRGWSGASRGAGGGRVWGLRGGSEFLPRLKNVKNAGKSGPHAPAPSPRRSQRLRSSTLGVLGPNWAQTGLWVSCGVGAGKFGNRAATNPMGGGGGIILCTARLGAWGRGDGDMGWGDTGSMGTWGWGHGDGGLGDGEIWGWVGQREMGMGGQGDGGLGDVGIRGQGGTGSTATPQTGTWGAVSLPQPYSHHPKPGQEAWGGSMGTQQPAPTAPPKHKATAVPVPFGATSPVPVGTVWGRGARGQAG